MMRSSADYDVTVAFSSAMARLGPFEPRPRLAAGVSGGADSMALALLAKEWARSRHGSLLALVVDHGLRRNSGAEAMETVARLTECDIAARLLRIERLGHGTAMAERARLARYQILTEACAAENIPHLLVGHHAADQVETVMMRVLGNSGDRGLAAMPMLTETAALRLLRPLLYVAPERLRAYLTERAVDWVEDPSNLDMVALRPRLRALAATQDQAPVLHAAALAGRERATAETRDGATMAERVVLRPEGFAILSPGPVAPEVLAALIRTISGDAYATSIERIATLAAQPRAATIGGVRLMAAGRLGPGWLLAREAAAMAPPIVARPGVTWDRRFRLVGQPPEGAKIGAVGADFSRFRRVSELPAAILETLPAIRCDRELVAVPHLLYRSAEACAGLRLTFSPSHPAAGAPFVTGQTDEKPA
jgi:tRNA(Ile)-lysidine synthase